MAGLAYFGYRNWQERARAHPPPVWRELIIMRYEAGKVSYEVNNSTVGSEADLTNELRKVRAKYELRRGDGIVAEFMVITEIRRDGEEGLTREHYERAKAACVAAGAKPEGLDNPPIPHLTVDVSLDESGLARYRCGKAIDALGERELGRQVAELVKERGGVVIDLSWCFGSLGAITQKHLDAAKAVCVSAGAEVKLPPPGACQPLNELAEMGIKLPEGCRIVVRAVGVRNGMLLFRVGGSEQLAEGNDALTQVLRRAVEGEEAKAGGVLPVVITYNVADELIQSDDQDRASRAAIIAAGPEVHFPVWGVFGYRDGGGRRIRMMRLEIVGACLGGSRYLLEGKPVKGDDALEVALAQLTAQTVAERSDRTSLALRVVLSDNANAGYQPSEEQIARARRIIAAGTAEPEKRVQINITGFCADGNCYRLEGQSVEGEVALKVALVKALAEHRVGRKRPEIYTLKLSLKVEVKPGVTATEEQISLARETIAEFCAQPVDQ